jgi:hypothetical protein
MKIAILITAYHKPNQLIQLVECLGNKLKYSDIYIHFDLKSGLDESSLRTLCDLGVNVLRRYRVYWGGFNQLKSIVSLVELALAKNKYDYLILISGQDVPIKSYEELVKFLAENYGKSFIDSKKFPIENWNYRRGFGRVHWFWFLDHIHYRGVHRLQRVGHYIFNKFSIVKSAAKGLDFYGGSDWWMLPGEVASLCLSEFKSNKKLVSCFRHSFIPSEMFFQTVINNSKFQATIVNNNKRYILWREGSGHPECLTRDEIDHALKSDCFFARKLDIDLDPVLVHETLSIF